MTNINVHRFKIGDVVRVNRAGINYHESLGIVQYCPMLNVHTYDVRLIDGAIAVLYASEMNLVDGDC